MDYDHDYEYDKWAIKIYDVDSDEFVRTDIIRSIYDDV
jgi:hypothetical protein